MKKQTLKIALMLTGLTLTSCNTNTNVKTYNVSFKGNNGLNHLTYVGENTASNDKDYVMSFAINYNYELELEDIHVYIGGNEDNTCWTFLYQTNEKNVFTIAKESITGDIVIDAKARYRTSTPSEYGFLIGEEYDMTVQVEEEGEMVDKPVFTYYFSDHREKKWIPTFDQLAYPVMEDDTVDFIIKLNEGFAYEGIYKILMDNIWFRSNARFTLEGVDFTRTYNDAHTECKIHIPHYVVRDHGSFRANINNLTEEEVIL